MAKKFSDLRAQMSLQAQARAKAKAQVMLKEISLNELEITKNWPQKLNHFPEDLIKTEHFSESNLIPAG